MRAVRIEQPGSAAGLRLVEIEDPLPGPAEICVDVHATALNRADWLQVLGKYPPPPGTPPDLPGMEYAGTVRSVGPRASRFRPGDRVMGLVPGAAFAERLITHEREAVPVPGPLSLSDAASIPEAFVSGSSTSWIVPPQGRPNLNASLRNWRSRSGRSPISWTSKRTCFVTGKLNSTFLSRKKANTTSACTSAEMSKICC